MASEKRIKSVAVVGAGAAGTITASALKAENYYERIRVFERRETAGGTWIYDADPSPAIAIQPGLLPPEVDPPLNIPDRLPRITTHNTQERYSQTPVYNSLTTNVPDIAMSFSDRRFAYGPFVPHYVTRQYLEGYHSEHKTDEFLELNTTVEDISQIAPDEDSGLPRWKLTLRKYDRVRHFDIWWAEIFDAVILGNGHYSVPYIPYVEGLTAYTHAFPGRVQHSKYYRTPLTFTNKKVLVIGNSASGHDITAELTAHARQPVYNSRRHRNRFEGDKPAPGIEWKPVITAFDLHSGAISFADGSVLTDIDHVIYATGYRPSYPFWNEKVNGSPLYDYEQEKLVGSYQHTFFRAFPTLAIVGLPRALTFRSFEYQAIAIARLWAGRSRIGLPNVEEQERWEREREEKTHEKGQKFHDITWDDGQTEEYLTALSEIAGLGTLKGDGRLPPVLSKELLWALEHLKKYPEPGKGKEGEDVAGEEKTEWSVEDEWVLVDTRKKDSLWFL